MCVLGHQRSSVIVLPVVRFGSRSARIFRLLLRKRHLEQKQVEDFAMVPAKEAKDMLYMLLSQNLVQLQVHAHTHQTCKTPN